MFAVMCVVQSHGGTPIEGHQTPVQGLQRIVLQERMVLSHVAQVDRELQICKEKARKRNQIITVCITVCITVLKLLLQLSRMFK